MKETGKSSTSKADRQKEASLDLLEVARELQTANELLGQCLACLQRSDGKGSKTVAKKIVTVQKTLVHAKVTSPIPSHALMMVHKVRCRKRDASEVSNTMISYSVVAVSRTIQLGGPSKRTRRVLEREHNKKLLGSADPQPSNKQFYSLVESVAILKQRERKR